MRPAPVQLRNCFEQENTRVRRRRCAMRLCGVMVRHACTCSCVAHGATLAHLGPSQQVLATDDNPSPCSGLAAALPATFHAGRQSALCSCSAGSACGVLRTGTWCPSAPQFWQVTHTCPCLAASIWSRCALCLLTSCSPALVDGCHLQHRWCFHDQPRRPASIKCSAALKGPERLQATRTREGEAVTMRKQVCRAYRGWRHALG